MHVRQAEIPIGWDGFNMRSLKIRDQFEVIFDSCHYGQKASQKLYCTSQQYFNAFTSTRSEKRD